MTTMSLPTSMNSVANLRAALTRLSQAGLTRRCWRRCRTCDRWIRLDHDFVMLAHAHQEPPSRRQQRRAVDHMAGARRARRRQDAARRRVGARAGAGRCRLMRTRRTRRIALVGETEHDVREVMIEGASGHLAHVAARRAAGMDRRRGGGWNGRTARWRRRFPPRTRRAARAAVRRRLVRRARQVAACGRDLRHAAVRPAARAAAAPARHHDAAADRR